MATIARTDRSTRLAHDLTGITSMDEAIRAADLDWGLNVVDAENLTITTPDGITATHIPGMRMVMRDDNHVTLGVVGGRYQAVDNHSVFALGETFLAQGATPREGGFLDHGRRAYMHFDLPEQTITVGGVDLVRFGVTIKAAHDGSGNVMAGITGERLVCTNGMTVSMVGLPHQFKIRHTASAASRMREAETVLAGATRYISEFLAAADAMMDTAMTETQYRAFIDRMFPEPSRDSARAHTMWENRRAELLSLWRFAATNDLGRGTSWAAFNSVTEYLDWVAPVRSAGGEPEEYTRALRQFDATNQDTKDRAFALLSA